jgi:ferritin-like protein
VRPAGSADAPPVPGAHPRLGKPSARWRNRDASGALLFEVWRFDPPGGRKQFLPLSLWVDPSGGLTWRWKIIPAPRPLYYAEGVAPEDMLIELRSDNKELTRNLRSTHEVCEQHHDVATASLIENWIDETERRTWFLSKIVG